MIYSNAIEIRKAAIQNPESIKATLNTFYERIEAQNPRLNAYVQLFKDQALARSEQLANVDNPEQLALYGVPVSIKESFVYSGSKTTINFPPLKDYAPNKTSILAKRLEDAGAIILGKTNVPLLVSDCQTFGPLYPTANNPYDLARTPGGSTGGGAAALAAGLSTLEIGSDIGGSIRNPASFCGVFGFKPTKNGHAHDGHVPPMPNRGNGFTALNSTGPLARTMSDIQTAFDTCYAPLPKYQQYLNVSTSTPSYNDLSGYKVGWYDEVLGLPCSKPTRQGMDRMVNALKEQGAQVENIKIDPDLAQRIYSTWLTLFGFVVGQDFPWFARQLLKLKFRHDLRHSSITDKRAMSKGLSMNFKRYSEAVAEQQACIAEFYRYFEDFDFILSPTSIGPAFEHNHKHHAIELLGETYSYSDYCFLFVMMHNLTGFPVLTIPSGLDETTNLPIGISVIAPHHSDKQLLHFGSLLEREGFDFKEPNA